MTSAPHTSTVEHETDELESEIETELEFEPYPRHHGVFEHWAPVGGSHHFLSITYGLATDEQIRGLFPKRPVTDDVLTSNNFLGEKSFELWEGANLVGMADVHRGPH